MSTIPPQRVSPKKKKNERLQQSMYGNHFSVTEQPETGSRGRSQQATQLVHPQAVTSGCLSRRDSTLLKKRVAFEML